MKNNFLLSLSLIFTLLSIGNLNAQESPEILKLKDNISSASTDKAIIEAYAHTADAYARTGQLDSTNSYLLKIIPITQKIKDTEMEGRITIFLGQVAMQKGETEKSFVYLKNAEQILKNSTNLHYKALINHLMAFANVLKKNDAEAKKYFSRNIKYFEEGKKIDLNLVAAAYQGLFSNNLMQNRLGDTYVAANNYLNFVKKNTPENLKNAYFFLGMFYINSKDNKKAISALKKNLSLTDKKDLKAVNTAYVYLSTAYKEMKKLDSAKYYNNKSLAYLETANAPKELSLAYYNTASIYEEENNFEEAEKFIRKAIKLVPEKDIESSNYNYNFMLHKIQLASIIKDSTRVKSAATQTKVQKILGTLEDDLKFINSTESLVSLQMKTELYKELSSANEYVGNYENAFKYQKMFTEENDKIYGTTSMKELSNLQSETELDNQRVKIRLEEETRRINLQKEIELKALRFEYEKKQNLAKTKEEKERLLLEEDLKRKEILIKYEQEQKAVELKYEQVAKLGKIEQEKKNAIAAAELESSKKVKNMWAVGAALSLLLLGFAAFSYFQKRKDNKKIAEEKEKSDALLLNILPFEVAEELKEKGKTSAKHYDEVSVLFTDFVNFTVNSEKIGVQEVIAELNTCFTEFDQIMGKYNLEKIKTIGDAYLAVSGLPIADGNHAQNAIDAALEILEFTKKRKIKNPNALDIRIGIHSGPVIAGIVGVKKFAYDIWGDTVNTAARMEQNSTPGRINVSETTYTLTKNDFSFEHRGEIETKGKGALNMYFAQSK